MMTTAAIVGMVGWGLAIGAGRVSERGTDWFSAACLQFASWGFVTAGLVVAYAAGAA